MAEVGFGCTVPTSGSGADPVALRDLAQTAEELGYDALWVRSRGGAQGASAAVIHEEIELGFVRNPRNRSPDVNRG